MCIRVHSRPSVLADAVLLPHTRLHTYRMCAFIVYVIRDARSRVCVSRAVPPPSSPSRTRMMSRTRALARTKCTKETRAAAKLASLRACVCVCLHVCVRVHMCCELDERLSPRRRLCERLRAECKQRVCKLCIVHAMIFGPYLLKFHRERF